MEVRSTEDRRAYEPYLARIHQRLLRTSDRPGFEELPGTLVFADVSGFTPLTERLARRGKVGAEELTDVLNSIFGTLLDRAAEFGGDLLKFGGDALLLLFDGEGHEARACAAALAMQGALRPFRQLKTNGGTVSLRMSIGVNSGPILVFLVGTTHQELLVAGPTMSRLVELESAADAGEVLVGAATAGAIDRRWLTDRTKDGGTLLRRTVRVVPPPNEIDGVPEGTAARTEAVGESIVGIPMGLRAHLAVRREEGEHRVAVLTFLQFKGIDQRLADDGPGVVRDLLHALVSRVQAAAERHGVHFLATDLDKDGGKILLAAGAPTASEDDEDRTLTALLDVLDDVPPGLMVRAGVNRGRAFAVDIGNERRRTYAVMGDPTNLAARVMGKAEAGGLLATDAVVAHTRRRYVLEAREPFLVKGKSEPVVAKRVRRMVAQAGRDRTDHGRVVGREHEQAALQRLVDRARRGDATTVELVAEPGMGKSTLVEHLIDAGRGMGRFAVEGTHYASTSPYLALRAPLRRAFTGLDVEIDDVTTLQLATSTFAPHLEPFVPLLGLLFGLELPDTPATADIDPSFRRSMLHKVAVEVLRATLPQPTLLIIEDAHWLDEASADLLSALIEAADDRPWGICITRRPGPLDLRLPDGATRLELAPLAAGAARALVDDFEVNLPPSVIARLVERSGGSPLFLQELLTAVQRGHAVDELPDSVEASIASRIDALGPDDRTLLRHAAVLGGRFTTAVLAEMLETDGAAVAAAGERLDGFLEAREDDAWAFRHALVRECAYESLPFRRRRELHLRAGALLEARLADDLGEWSDLLSLHFAAAGDDERTWRYSCIAGDRARRAFAPVEAATFYRRGAEAARRLPAVEDEELGAVYETLGDCLRYSGAYGDAVAAYREARRTRHDPVRIADLHRKEGMVRERTGRFADALRWYTRGRRMIEGMEPAQPEADRVLAQLSVAAGAARLRQGRYLEGIPLLEAAARLAERLDDQETLAHSYDLLDWAHTDLGNEDRHRYRELALPIFERLGNLHRQGVVASNLGIDAYFEGRWDDAVDWYERGRAASERAGDVVQMATAINNLGEVESDRGHLDVAKHRFETARRIWRDAPFPIGVALATSNLGRVAVRAGELDAARGLLDEARRDFAWIGADSYVIETDVRELERLVAAAQAEDALALADDIAGRARRAGGLPLQVLPTDRARAYARAQLGHLGEAFTLLHDVAERAEAMDAGFELALTLEALARVATAAGDATAEAYRIAAGQHLDRLGVVRTAAVPVDAPAPAGV